MARLVPSTIDEGQNLTLVCDVGDNRVVQSASIVSRSMSVASALLKHRISQVTKSGTGQVEFVVQKATVALQGSYACRIKWFGLVEIVTSASVGLLVRRHGALAMDLLVIVDDSKHVEAGSFNNTRGFLQSLVVNLDPKISKGTRLGVMLCGSTVVQQFGVNEFTTQDGVLRALALAFHEQRAGQEACNITEAMASANQHLLSMNMGNRHIILIISSGKFKAGEVRQQRELYALRLHQRGVNVFVIDTRKDKLPSELYQVCSTPREIHLYLVNGYSLLMSTLKILKTAINRSECSYISLLQCLTSA